MIDRIDGMKAERLILRILFIPSKKALPLVPLFLPEAEDCFFVEGGLSG